MQLSILADLMLKDFVSSSEAGLLLGFDNALRTTFIAEIDALKLDYALNNIAPNDPTPLETLLKKYQRLHHESKKITSLKEAADELVLSNVLEEAAQTFSNVLLFSPSPNPNSATVSNTVREMTSEQLQTACSIIAIPALFQILETLKNESTYHKKMASLSHAHEKILHQTAASYAALQNTYQTLAKTYTAILTRIKNNPPIDETAYHHALMSWLAKERALQHYIHLQQEKIAVLSAALQETQSTRRLQRITEGLATVLTLASLSGPPAAMAGAAVKLMIHSGCHLVGHAMIHESAALNHGVINAAHHDLETHFKKTKTPLLVFTPISLDTKKVALVAGIDIAKEMYRNSLFSENVLAHAANILSEKLANLADNAVSCAYIPALLTHPPAFEKSNLKAYTQLLEKTLDALYAETVLFEKTLEKLADKNPSPYLTNFDEILHQLQTTLTAIKQQRETLNLPILQKREEHLQQRINNLRLKKTLLDLSPHSALFLNSPEKKEAIVLAYTSNTPLAQKANAILLRDMLHQIHLTQKLQSSITEAEGKYIKNLGDNLIQWQSLLSLINADAADYKKSIFEIAEIGLTQIKWRLDYLNQHMSSYTPQEFHSALSDLKTSLFSFKQFYESSPGHILQNIDISFLEKSLQAAETKNLPRLEKALEEGPVFMHQIMNEPSGNIHNTSRLFFGLRKQADIEKDITQKIEVLEKNHVTRVQLAPLKPITEEMIAHCEQDYSQLAKMIEGLKTEIQWVLKFQQVADKHQITIANLDGLITAYEQQCQLLKQICDKHSHPHNPQRDSFLWTSASLQAFFEPHKKELHKAGCVLAELKNTLTPRLIAPDEFL